MTTSNETGTTAGTQNTRPLPLYRRAYLLSTLLARLMFGLPRALIRFWTASAKLESTKTYSARLTLKLTFSEEERD